MNQPLKINGAFPSGYENSEPQFGMSYQQYLFAQALNGAMAGQVAETQEINDNIIRYDRDPCVAVDEAVQAVRYAMKQYPSVFERGAEYSESFGRELEE